jgi:hypothetical protein
VFPVALVLGCLFVASKRWVLSVPLKRALPTSASRLHRFSPSPFHVSFMRVWLSFDQRVIWDDDQLLATWRSASART